MGAADKPVILLSNFIGFPALGRDEVLSLSVASVTFSGVLTLQMEVVLHFHLFVIFEVKSTSRDVGVTPIEVASTLSRLLGG